MVIFSSPRDCVTWWELASFNETIMYQGRKVHRDYQSEGCQDTTWPQLYCCLHICSLEWIMSDRVASLVWLPAVESEHYHCHVTVAVSFISEDATNQCIILLCYNVFQKRRSQQICYSLSHIWGQLSQARMESNGPNFKNSIVFEHLVYTCSCTQCWGPMGSTVTCH